MKSPYWIAGGVLVTIILVVLLVPGIGNIVETLLLVFLASIG